MTGIEGFIASIPIWIALALPIIIPMILKAMDDAYSLEQQRIDAAVVIEDIKADVPKTVAASSAVIAVIVVCGVVLVPLTVFAIFKKR